MELFKYRGNFERDLLTLSSNQIFAPTLEKLNDPFEGLLNSKWDQITLDAYELKNSRNLRIVYEQIVQDLKNQGIYSLSQDFKNEILWSLYANGHQGFVVGYDILQLIGSINCRYTHPIVYRVPVEYCDNPKGLLQWRNEPSLAFNMSNGLGVKSKSWAHEYEIRLVFEESGFFEYHFTSVSRIIFGLRTTDESINQTMNILRGRNYKYQKIVMDDDSFTLKIIDLKDLYKTEIRYQQNLAELDESLLCEDNLKCTDKALIEKIKTKVNNIRQMPKILRIVSIQINQQNYPQELRISCLCDGGQIADLLYKNSLGEFIRIPYKSTPQ